MARRNHIFDIEKEKMKMYVKMLSFFFYQGKTTKLKTIGYFYMSSFSVSLWVSFQRAFYRFTDGGAMLQKTTERILAYLELTHINISYFSIKGTTHSLAHCSLMGTQYTKHQQKTQHIVGAQYLCVC